MSLYFTQMLISPGDDSTRHYRTRGTYKHCSHELHQASHKEILHRAPFPLPLLSLCNPHIWISNSTSFIIHTSAKMLSCRTVISICCLALQKKKKKASNNSCYWDKKSIWRNFADAELLGDSHCDECESVRQTARWWTQAVRRRAENQQRLMKLYWSGTLSIDLLWCTRSGLGLMSSKPVGEPMVKEWYFLSEKLLRFTQLLPKKPHALQSKKNPNKFWSDKRTREFLTLFFQVLD